MYPCSIQTLQADALFASTLQHSDDPSILHIRRAIAMALDTYGAAGCAGRVAQEFGDHPESAAVRMRWARATAVALDSQFVPTIRRMPTADRSVLGQEGDGGAVCHQVSVSHRSHVASARPSAVADDPLDRAVFLVRLGDAALADLPAAS